MKRETEQNKLRAYTVEQLFKKKFKTFIPDGIWGNVLGEQERKGIWLIYGAEKNGKTWLALQLANMLTKYAKVLYVSAEEGTDKSFISAMSRAGIDYSKKKLSVINYMPIKELEENLQKKRSSEVVFIDNCSVYNDDFRGVNPLQWTAKFSKKLFIFLAHEESKMPYPALGRTLRRFAKVIMRVQGFKADVSGRCPGGTITIDEQQAGIIWGKTEN